MKSKIKLTQRAMGALVVLALALNGCITRAQTSAPIAAVDTASVKLLKTPNGGIQPQAALDDKGVLHLIYFAGQPAAGDIFYVRSTDNGQSFSAPIRVNSQPNSAIATGTIRGAQLALGKDDRVHVAWNGSGVAQPKGAGGTPILYARLNDAGTAFEAQRNLITWAGGIDGGGTLAADKQGDVYVAWHATPEDKDESERAVYLSRSTDNGQSFAREKRINPDATGACGCCQMRAFADTKGALYVLYRTAGNNLNRDTTLLVSTDKGDKFTSVTLDKWNIAACPMSSFAMTQNLQAQKSNTVFAAWQTEDQVYMSAVASPTHQKSAVIAAPGAGKARKHPVVMAGADGQILFAWTEGTGWNRGGNLAWQIYDADGQPTAQKGRTAGVPVWSLLSAVAQPDGGFILFY